MQLDMNWVHGHCWKKMILVIVCAIYSTLEEVVVCNDTLGVVGVLNYYCLTSDDDQSVVKYKTLSIC